MAVLWFRRVGGAPTWRSSTRGRTHRLTPFNENTVASGSVSVSAYNACAMHLSGHGTLERCRCCFDGSRKSCAHVSSGMAPNSPIWFLKGAILPTLTTSRMTAGSAPLAKWSDTRNKKCKSRDALKTKRKCSEVIPDGPGAAPRRDGRRILQKIVPRSKKKKNDGTSSSNSGAVEVCVPVATCGSMSASNQCLCAIFKKARV